MNWERTRSFFPVCASGVYLNHAGVAPVSTRAAEALERYLAEATHQGARNYAASRLGGRRATWGPVVPGLREFAGGHSASETAAFQWLRLNEIALEDLQASPASSWMQVRFEDLIRDPAGSFAQIAAFAEVEDPEAVVRYACRHVDPDNIPHLAQGIRAEPTTEEWGCVHRLIDDFQGSLGYGRRSEPLLEAL